jgi:predicted dehydrogenase
VIRLALVGCGEHSRISHAMPLARYARQHPEEIELAAVCDLNLRRAEEFSRKFGFRQSYSEVKAMLSSEQLDGCISVMPMNSIVSMATLLMELKIPCMIEKPLGTSDKEAVQLAEVARSTQTPHMVSVNRRFMPFLNQAKSWASGIGPIQYVRATQVRHLRGETDFIWSTAIHVLDALRHVAGEVVTFDTRVQRSGELSTSWYGISLHFKNGARGTIEVLPTAGMIEESYELFGEGYRARVLAGSGTQRSLECWRDGKMELESHSVESEPEDLRNGSYEEVVEFVKALQSGRPPKPSVEDILPSAKICFAIAEREGKRLGCDQ